MTMMTLPVLVDEGVEGHPVPPAGGEVVDVDVGIPEEETHLVRMKIFSRNSQNTTRDKEMLRVSDCHNLKY